MNYRLSATNGQGDESLKFFENKYVPLLETKIRNASTNAPELKRSLFELGTIFGQEICIDNMVSDVNIITPMNIDYMGISIDNSKEYVVVSTKDDFQYFANGIATTIGDCLRGYIDFGGSRGQDIFSSPIRSIDLPDIKTGRLVELVIIAKSVLATGCTAISLARKAMEKYMPSKIIIASAFYSERGIHELKHAIPPIKIYVCNHPDSLNNDGMLLPGVGNIDMRLSQ